MTGEPAIRTQPALAVQLRHRFASGFQLDVSFEATSGALALFGPSGSGKTTILSALAGLFRPDAGRIAFGDQVLFDRAGGVDLPPRARHVGLVLQDGLLFPHRTVRENLLFGAPRENARLDLERVAGLLEIAHLLDARPRALSGGERQRVALGRAVLSEPGLLLCDEPFAALDAPRRRRLIPILARLRAELDIPLVLVSHDPSEVLALASEVVVLDEGRVKAQGPTPSLLATLAEDDGAALNFWEGEVVAAEPATGEDAEHPLLYRVRVGETDLHLPLPGAEPGQRVRFVVDPRHVALAKANVDAPPASPRNRLEGTVTAVDPDQGLLRITIDAGLPLTALVTPGAAEELSLAAGTEVVARFKAAAVRVLARL